MGLRRVSVVAAALGPRYYARGTARISYHLLDYLNKLM